MIIFIKVLAKTFKVVYQRIKKKLDTICCQKSTKYKQNCFVLYLNVNRSKLARIASFNMESREWDCQWQVHLANSSTE